MSIIFITTSPPFSGQDAMDTYNLILRGIEAVNFPRTHISKLSARLIKDLCQENPGDRLGRGRNGLEDLKQHS